MYFNALDFTVKNITQIEISKWGTTRSENTDAMTQGSLTLCMIPRNEQTEGQTDVKPEIVI